MADNIYVDPGTGASKVHVAADDVSTVYYQKIKVDGGGDGVSTPILAGGGVEASALRVTIASDSTGVVSVDDNGGALTVDGTVAATQSGTWNVATVTAVTGITNAVAVTDNSSTLSVDDGGGALTVDGTVTANLAAGTNNIGDVDVLSIAAGDNNIGNVDLASAIPAGTNIIGKVSIDQVTANANEVVVKSITAGDTNIGNVDIASAIPAGDNNIGNVDVVTLPAVSGTVAVSGVTGTVTIAGAVTNAGTFATQVTAGTITAVTGITNALPAGTNNIGVVTPWVSLANLVSGTSGTITTTAAGTIIAAQGAGTVTYLTNVLVTNGGTVSTWVQLLDGATIKYEGYAASSGGGFVVPCPAPLAGSANTAWCVQCGTTGAAVIANASGFKI